MEDDEGPMLAAVERLLDQSTINVSQALAQAATTASATRQAVQLEANLDTIQAQVEQRDAQIAQLQEVQLTQQQMNLEQRRQSGRQLVQLQRQVDDLQAKLSTAQEEKQGQQRESDALIDAVNHQLQLALEEIAAGQEQLRVVQEDNERLRTELDQATW